MTRLPIILVVGSGKNSYSARSETVGKLLACRPVHLLTGGGQGVMAEVSKFFAQTTGRVGNCIGVVPSGDTSWQPKKNYPNEWVEIAIFTHLSGAGGGEGENSRNHINVLSATGVIALPGGRGTLAEIKLAIRYARPCVAYIDDKKDITGLPDEVKIVDYQGLVDFINQFAKEAV